MREVKVESREEAGDLRIFYLSVGSGQLAGVGNFPGIYGTDVCCI